MSSYAVVPSKPGSLSCASDVGRATRPAARSSAAGTRARLGSLPGSERRRKGDKGEGDGESRTHNSLRAFELRISDCGLRTADWIVDWICDCGPRILNPQ